MHSLFKFSSVNTTLGCVLVWKRLWHIDIVTCSCRLTCVHQICKCTNYCKHIVKCLPKTVSTFILFISDVPVYNIINVIIYTSDIDTFLVVVELYVNGII